MHCVELMDGLSLCRLCQGNRLMPQCGYSGTLVNILQSLSVPFETVDVLADERIRQGIKASTKCTPPPPVGNPFGFDFDMSM